VGIIYDGVVLVLGVKSLHSDIGPWFGVGGLLSIRTSKLDKLNQRLMIFCMSLLLRSSELYRFFAHSVLANGSRHTNMSVARRTVLF
jgi:hypothetical protein